MTTIDVLTAIGRADIVLELVREAVIDIVPGPAQDPVKDVIIEMTTVTVLHLLVIIRVTGTSIYPLVSQVHIPMKVDL